VQAQARDWSDALLDAMVDVEEVDPYL